MRQFPVGSINAKGIENHLGALIHRAMRDVLRPFLEAWQADYRFWWEYTSDKTKAPLQRQNMYPRAQDMLVEWRQLKMTLRAVQDTLEKAYKLNR